MAMANNINNIDELINSIENSSVAPQSKAALKRQRQKQRQQQQQTEIQIQVDGGKVKRAETTKPTETKAEKSSTLNNKNNNHLKQLILARQREQALKESADRQRKEDEEAARLAALELERVEREKAEQRQRARLERREQQRKDGVLLSKTEKERQQRNQRYLQQLQVQDLMSSKAERTFSATKTTTSPPTLPLCNAAPQPPQQQQQQQEEHRYQEHSERQCSLRSPVCCVLGHVDHGKTTLLDAIRGTREQRHEAGAITQKISAAFVDVERSIWPRIVPLSLSNSTTASTSFQSINDVEISGMVFIDTPGHDSFQSLRSRGSSLCDLAILVVDITQNLEPQTIESISLLKQHQTPFIVALTKLDKCYGWKSNPSSSSSATVMPIMDIIASQSHHNVQLEFERRVRDVQLALNKEGLNCALFTENDDERKVVSMVPVSAHTGEGIGDLLHLMVRMAHQQLKKTLTPTTTLQCTILDVNELDGYGATIDALLINGEIRVQDVVVCSGLKGPVKTHVRALLVDGVRVDRVSGARCVKICGPNLEDALAGGQCLLSTGTDDTRDVETIVQEHVSSVLSLVKASDVGISVLSSSLGALEAAYDLFVNKNNVAVNSLGLGNITRRDVLRASTSSKPELKVVAGFDVDVASADVHEYAIQMGVKIITSNVLYQAYTAVHAHIERSKLSQKRQIEDDVVFPLILNMLPGKVFHNKDPLVLGCKVISGTARLGTPLVVPAREREGEALYVGRIVGIQQRNKDVVTCKKGDEVAVKIEMDAGGPNIVVGRQLHECDVLVSRITRQSIDLLKQHYRNEMTTEDWKVVVQIKILLQIQ